MARRPTEIPIERRVRVGILGLGQVYDLCATGYRGNRLKLWLCATLNQAESTSGQATGLAPNGSLTSRTSCKPTWTWLRSSSRPPLHCNVACAVLGAGYDVNLQIPIARTMDELDRILAARNKSEATLRIREDYLFFEPLVRLN